MTSIQDARREALVAKFKSAGKSRAAAAALVEAVAADDSTEIVYAACVEAGCREDFAALLIANGVVQRLVREQKGAA